MKCTTLLRTVGGGELLLALILMSGCGSDEKTTAPQKTDTIDEVAPLTPVGVAARKNQAHGFAVGWRANSEPDLMGYKVYVFGADPTFADAFGLVTELPLLGNSFSWVDASGEIGQFVIRVSAVDESGNESIWSAEVVAEIVGTTKEALESGPDGNGGGGGRDDDTQDTHPPDGDEPVDPSGR